MRGLRGWLAAREPAPEPAGLSAEDRRYLETLHDESVPLPTEAEAELVPSNPRLVELRQAYAALEHPVLVRSRWHSGAVNSFLDLRWFRGETLFVWHYRELPRITQLKYFIFAQYVRDRDQLGLLERLEEDGQFGCWTYSYSGWPRLSRDLLQSVNEISFLERALGISSIPSLSVLDVGAGYGRLAHRMAAGLPNLAGYWCTDAIPEATFLSDWYLRYRGCVPPARVVRLDRISQELEPGSFQLAVNIHSFSECPLAAIQWWIGLLASLDVRHLLIVPNEPTELLSTEADGSRRDYAPVLAAAGYRLAGTEPVIDDPPVRALLPLGDHFHLFSRE